MDSAIRSSPTLTHLRRAGRVSDEVVRLAAFCGDVAARRVDGWVPDDEVATDVGPAWLAGLRRLVDAVPGACGAMPWPQRLALVAGVAAAREVERRSHQCYSCGITERSGRTISGDVGKLPCWQCGTMIGAHLAPLRAIRAAQAYLDEPSEARLSAVCDLRLRLAGALPSFAWQLLDMVCETDADSQLAAVLTDAARLADVRPGVSAALLKEVVTWSD